MFTNAYQRVQDINQSVGPVVLADLTDDESIRHSHQSSVGECSKTLGTSNRRRDDGPRGRSWRGASERLAKEPTGMILLHLDPKLRHAPPHDEVHPNVLSTPSMHDALIDPLS